jgi:hypothetical protein
MRQERKSKRQLTPTATTSISPDSVTIIKYTKPNSRPSSYQRTGQQPELRLPTPEMGALTLSNSNDDSYFFWGSKGKSPLSYLFGDAHKGMILSPHPPLPSPLYHSLSPLFLSPLFPLPISILT